MVGVLPTAVGDTGVKKPASYSHLHRRRRRHSLVSHAHAGVKSGQVAIARPIISLSWLKLCKRKRHTEKQNKQGKQRETEKEGARKRDTQPETERTIV